MAQTNEISQQKQDPDALCVVPDLQEAMNADLVLKPDGSFCIFHDQPLSARLEYVEFDSSRGQLSLILRNGVVQPFGEDIPEEYHERLDKAENIYVIFGQGGQVRDIYDAKLLKQQSGLV